MYIWISEMNDNVNAISKRMKQLGMLYYKIPAVPKKWYSII